jgi:hypothetical protein
MSAHCSKADLGSDGHSESAHVPARTWHIRRLALLSATSGRQGGYRQNGNGRQKPDPEGC